MRLPVTVQNTCSCGAKHPRRYRTKSGYTQASNREFRSYCHKCKLVRQREGILARRGENPRRHNRTPGMSSTKIDNVVREIRIHGCILVPTARRILVKGEWIARCKDWFDCPHMLDCLDAVSDELWPGFKVTGHYNA